MSEFIMKPIRVLFVCMGNICRSPAAEGILKHFAQHYPQIQVEVESCGIGDWHLGSSPDHRMLESSKARGIYLTSKARQFQKSHLEQFDYILASDIEIRNTLYHSALSPEHKAKIGLMTDYSPLHKGEDIPDPYYQAGGGAFELVLDMLEDSCVGLLKHLAIQEGKDKNKKMAPS